MSNSIAPGSSADVNVRVTALTTNPNVPVTYKTIILKKNLVNGVNTLTQEMMSTTNTKYVVKYDYVLDDDIIIPANCILEFYGGSLSNGNIILSDNNRIEGNGTTLYKVRILATNKSSISISGLKLDSRLNGVDDDTFKSFVYLNGCSNIVIDDIDLVFFHHTWLDGESGDTIHVMYFNNCNTIRMYNVRNSGDVHPEGPAFYFCTKVLVDSVFLSDEGLTNAFSTCLHCFYCHDVIVRDSTFYHRIASGGSTINFTVDKGIIDNCNLTSGFGFDLGNEDGTNFESEYIIIRNCRLDRTKFICYGSGSDKYTIDNLIVENCTAENVVSTAFNLRDSIKNVKVSNCNITFTDGRTICNIAHDANYGTNISVELDNINCNISSIYNGSIFYIENGANLKKGKITDSTIVKASNTTYTRNYISFCETTSESATTPEIIVENCEITAPRFAFDTFACSGDIKVLNNVLKTHNEISGQSGQVNITRNTTNTVSPNTNIVIGNNVFYGISFRIINTTAKVSLVNNRFGISAAGGNDYVFIQGEDTSNAVANLLITGNYTQESSKKINNYNGVLDSSVIVEDNYNITKEGFS